MGAGLLIDDPIAKIPFLFNKLFRTVQNNCFTSVFAIMGSVLVIVLVPETGRVSPAEPAIVAVRLKPNRGAVGG